MPGRHPNPSAGASAAGSYGGITGPIAANFGIGAVMALLAIIFIATASAFAVLTSPPRT